MFILTTITKHKGAAISVAALLGLTLIASRPAKAFGWPVFDFSTFTAVVKTWRQDISTTQKIIQEIAVAQKILQNGMQMYAAEQYMQQRFSHGMKSAMMTMGPQVIGNYTQNKYGETVMLPTVWNGNGTMAKLAWLNATLAMTSGALAPMAGKAPGSSKDLAELAFVEQADGTSVQCMQNLAQYQALAQQNQGKVGFLDFNKMDDSTSTGSLIKSLSLAALGQSQANNEQRAQGSIQNCLAQQQVLQAKHERDQMVYSMNYAAQTQANMRSPQYTWDGQTAYNTVIP